MLTLSPVSFLLLPRCHLLAISLVHVGTSSHPSFSTSPPVIPLPFQRCFDVLCGVVLYFAFTRFVPFLFWLLGVFVGVSVFSTCYAAELSRMVGAVPPSDLIRSMRAIDPCCAFLL